MLQNIFFLFPFENRQADISRMLARIESSNVELLYIQTGTRGAFNSSDAYFVKTCNPNLFFFTLFSLQDLFGKFEEQWYSTENSLKIVIKMYQKVTDI